MLWGTRLLGQMIRYAGAGGVSAIGHYSCLILAVEWGGMNPVIASIVASVVGAVINYLVNYHYTFASDAPHLQSVARFCTVAATGMGWNAAIMWVGTQAMSANYLLTQIVATVLVFFWNFFNNRRWTFHRSQSDAQEGGTAKSPRPEP